MSYNSTYYFEEPEYEDNIHKQDGIQEKTDIFFVGADKGRYDKLMKFKVAAEAAGLKTDFRIVRDATSVSSGEYSSRVDYDEVVKLIKESRAILEILQEGQTGISLRPMEAIFFGKKLITDNQTVRKERFYDTKSILLLDELYMGKDFSETLYHFVRDEAKTDRTLVDYYDFRNWLRRFEQNEER